MIIRYYSAAFIFRVLLFSDWFPAPVSSSSSESASHQIAEVDLTTTHSQVIVSKHESRVDILIPISKLE
jgi:hypothetical protein